MYCIFTKDGIRNFEKVDTNCFWTGFQGKITSYMLNLSLYPTSTNLYTYILSISIHTHLLYIHINSPKRGQTTPFPSCLSNDWMVQWTKVENPGSLFKSQCSLVAKQLSEFPLCGNPNPQHLSLTPYFLLQGKAADISPQAVTRQRGAHTHPPRWPSEAWQGGGIKGWGKQERKQGARGGDRQKPLGSEM